MSQLGSFLPAATQNNLLNSVNLLQTMQQLAGINPLLFSQLPQSMGQPNMMKNMNQVNANLLKNFPDFYKIPTNIPMTSASPQNITSDHMRQLSNLAQSINMANTNLINPQTSIGPTIPKSTYTNAKPSASISKTTSITSINKNANPTFKYPAEICKPKTKDVTKTTSSYIPKVKSPHFINIQNQTYTVSNQAPIYC